MKSSSDPITGLDCPNSIGGIKESLIVISNDEDDCKPEVVEVLDHIGQTHNDCAVSNNQSHLTERSTSPHSLPMKSSSDPITGLDCPDSTDGTKESPIVIPDDEDGCKLEVVEVLDHVGQTSESEPTEDDSKSESSSTIPTVSQATHRVVKRSKEVQGSGNITSPLGLLRIR